MKHTKNFRATSVSLRGFARPLRPSSFVLIAASALCLVSCKSARSVTNAVSSSSDSLNLHLIQGVKVSGQTAPASVDAARVTLPLESLALLPDGASYTGRQGTARVTATRKGENLVLEGESLTAGVCSLTVESTQAGNATGKSQGQSEATHRQGGKQSEQTRWPRDALAAVLILAGTAALLIWLRKRP